MNTAITQGLKNFGLMVAGAVTYVCAKNAIKGIRNVRKMRKQKEQSAEVVAQEMVEQVEMMGAQIS